MPTATPSVLIVTRTFPPDPAAVGQLVAELARELAGRGWRVGIATTSPAGESTEPIAGVEVARVASRFAFTRASTLRRALSYLSIFPALLWAAWQLPGRWDFIVTTSDPPLQVLVGPLLRAAKGGRLIQWSQDLYPEIAEELEVLKRDGPVARALRALSNWGLRRCDLVLVPGRCMAARLRQRGTPGDRIRVVPNWSDPARVRPVDRRENAFRREQGISETTFVAMYSGNIGLAHRFEAILGAAGRLGTARPEILFLIVGDGPRAESVRADATRLKLPNVRFLPLQPRERLTESLGAADVHLVTMSARLCGLVVPSKFYGVLAAGRPCVFVGPAESEVAAVIRETGCGVVVNEGDEVALAAALTGFADGPAAHARAGMAARVAAEQYSLSACTDKLLAAWQMKDQTAGEGV